MLGVPNTIRLREVGVSSSDYATSSLGTSFVIDGAPVSTDANMQYIAGSSLYDPIVNYSYFVNAGVDMRTHPPPTRSNRWRSCVAYPRCSMAT